MRHCMIKQNTFSTERVESDANIGRFITLLQRITQWLGNLELR